MAVRYQELLVSRGVWDFDDVLARALEVVQHSEVRRFRFAVVDEAQDLSLLAVRLVAALVTDERDGLTLVGDGQQSVYPGGYVLREAGISVTGRATVLRVNYRNTREVLDAAARVVQADDYDDLEGVAEPGRRDTDVLRSGPPVRDVIAPDRESADAALTRALLDLPDRAGCAVLCRTGAERSRVHRVLARVGIATVDLEDYDGTPTEAVKVGTAKRAKGLEFAVVLLPYAESWRTGAEEPELAARERRELFVAMTRARDQLWMCRVV